MKKLVVTFGFALITSVVVGQTNSSKKTTPVSEINTITVQLPTVKKALITDYKTTRLLLKSDFDKAALMFRGKKSKREDVC